MDKDTRPKRYFLRRLAAFAVDFILAYAVAVVVLMALDAVTGSDFYYWNGLATRTACVDAPPSPLLDEINSSHPVAPGWSRGAVVCLSLPVGGKARHMLNVRDELHDGNVTRTTWFNIPVTATGDHPDPGLRLDPTAFVAYAFLLAWMWRFGRSPGKRWLGLVVQPVADADGAGWRLLRREWFRLGPLALLSLVEVVVVVAGWWFVESLSDYGRLMQFIADNSVLLIVLYTMVALPGAVYYVFPFVRWRGQTFYDRFAGTMVTRG
ncbi:MAG: putative transrane protein [Proteobacteria bacterium]|nr:putative transrane protein [Pseudomonadota bacterium]